MSRDFGRATVFDNIAVTTTTDLHGLSDSSFIGAASILLEVVGATAPNWTLDIQGRVHPSGVYTALDYIQLWQAGTRRPSNAQLTISDTTRRFYLVLSPPQFVRLVATRTAGNLTVHAGYSAMPSVPVGDFPPGSTDHATATAAVNTALTATLAAAGVGLFHHIVRIELIKLYNAVGVAAAAGVIVTTTNLPGSPAFTTEQAAGALGTAPKVIDINFTHPLKSSTANTATTFVAPAQLETIWRWNITYYIGP